METRNSAQNAQGRIITAQQVSQRLRAAIIPKTGANKLPLVGAGNSFTRENGTRVRIFNVLAFADHASAAEAKKLFLQGYELEKQGLGATKECQDAFKGAYNKLMNFSVLAQNEHKFVEFDEQGRAFLKCFEVECRIDHGTNRQGQPMLQLNAVRPAKVETAGESTEAMFALPADVINTQQPAPQPTEPAPANPMETPNAADIAQPQAQQQPADNAANIPDPADIVDDNTPF